MKYLIIIVTATVLAFNPGTSIATDKGNAVAQYFLGNMYDHGQGVPQNYTEALKWYRLSAEQGDADAQNNLGVMYADGKGSDKATRKL